MQQDQETDRLVVHVVLEVNICRTFKICIDDAIDSTTVTIKYTDHKQITLS